MEFDRNDILEIERRIINLIFDGKERPRYRACVNRIFMDLFGVEGIGNAFVGEGGRNAMRTRIRLYDVAGTDRLYDMLVDENHNEYQVLQLMVALLRGTDDSRDTKDTRLEYVKKYNGLLELLRNEFDIKTIPSIDSILNPLKTAKRLLRDRDDYGYGYYDDYDYDRRFKSYDYSRRGDDEYGYSDSYFDRILKGTDYETAGRSKKKSYGKSKKKYSSESDDDDSDYDGAETDATTEAIIEMSDQIKTVANAVKKLQENQNKDSADIPVQDPYKGRNEQSHDAMLRLIKQVVKSVNKLESKNDSITDAINSLNEHVRNIESDIYVDAESDDIDDVPVNSNMQVDIDDLLLSNDSSSDQNT